MKLKTNWLYILVLFLSACTSSNASPSDNRSEEIITLILDTTTAPSLEYDPELVLPTATQYPIEINSYYEFLPSGDYIVFLGEGHNSLQVFSIENKNVYTLVEGDLGELSNDGKKIAFINKLPDSSLVIIYDLERDKVEIDLVIEKKCYGVFSWSPDNSKITSICNDGVNFIDTLTHEIDSVTAFHEPGTVAFFEPVWSPNGEWIAYGLQSVMETPSPIDGVYLVPATCYLEIDTCEQNTKGPFFQYLTMPIIDWSSDNTKLVISDELGQRAIRQLDIETGEETMLFNEYELPDDVHGVVWSLDGEWIAFGQSDGIYIVSEEGGEAVPIFSSSDVEWVIDWIYIP